ncbi:MAG TPA: TIGR03435 family protein [Bryobacteraceae bacterium]|nr:TIGR03435 family protein [Bryobacteraceae bacterium]
MRKALLSLGLMAGVAFAAFGQEAAVAPEFEAASVKPAEPLNVGSMMAGGRVQVRMGCSFPDPGRFTCFGMPLRALLVAAYELKNYQFSGPAWMDSERFDIVAKVPAGATREQVDRMTQRLLLDRFQMAVHRETRELPMFALVVGRNGHKLRAPAEGGQESPIDQVLAGRGAPPPPPPGGSGQVNVMMVSSGSGAKGGVMMTMRNGLNEIAGRKATLASLAGILSTQVNRPVVDETGLTGEYDFTFDFAADETVRPGGASGAVIMTVPGPPPSPGGGGAAPGAETRDPASAPSIFSAIQNQLGLKLEPKKGPVEMLVVDKAGKVPVAN